MSPNEKLHFDPINCLSCGRANHPSASRCLWCGVPILTGDESDPGFLSTTVELDYLDGIERLDNPEPVRLSITLEGIEVKEVLPGSRRYFIAADALIEANFTDASVLIEEEAKRSLWGWLMMGSAAAREAKKVTEVKHDYIVTVRYRTEDAIKTAVFHREDSLGLSLIKNVANIINTLVKLKALKS